jgi:hypothetical protein
VKFLLFVNIYINIYNMFVRVCVVWFWSCRAESETRSFVKNEKRDASMCAFGFL